MKQIVIAGGCFWGVEAYYQRLKGIINTKVGYANGTTKNPTYQQLIHGQADHAEAVYLNYDHKIISLNKILEHMFRFIDPTLINRQGNDIGSQYRTGIYYLDQEDYLIINQFINEQQAHYHQPLKVEVLPLDNFYDGEDYHQRYLDKNPFGYCHVNLNLIKDDERK